MIAALLLGCSEPDPPAEPVVVVDDGCPPEGEVGLEVGDTVEDLPFETCEGEPWSLHEGCGRPTLVQNLYAWCGPCLEHLELSSALLGVHPDLDTVVVLTEDVLGDPPDRAFCRELTRAYAIDGLVVLDPERRLEATYGGPGLVLVLDRAAVVTFARTDATEDAIVAAVEAAVD